MNKEIRFRAYDDTGNYGEWTGYYTLKIDKSAPSVPTYSGLPTASYVNYDYSLVLHSEDEVSGIDHYEMFRIFLGSLR